jgi:hypothetical protein
MDARVPSGPGVERWGFGGVRPNPSGEYSNWRSINLVSAIFIWFSFGFQPFFLVFAVLRRLTLACAGFHRFSFRLCPVSFGFRSAFVGLHWLAVAYFGFQRVTGTMWPEITALGKGDAQPRAVPGGRRPRGDKKRAPEGSLFWTCSQRQPTQPPQAAADDSRYRPAPP